jgi:cell division protein FtsW
VLFIFVARYLSKTREPITLSLLIWELWLPVFITLILLPANFSTTALIFAMILMLVFIGKYPLKYIGAIVGSGILFRFFLFLLPKLFLIPGF